MFHFRTQKLIKLCYKKEKFCLVIGHYYESGKIELFATFGLTDLFLEFLMTKRNFAKEIFLDVIFAWKNALYFFVFSLHSKATKVSPSSTPSFNA